ncbi:MAG: sulfur carrier protein ThiS [Epsilonproteobacteria bacterium]|nr:sulfur carrier protein ThiS [Campylobacterota bacterium]
MKIILNGKEYQLKENTTLKELIKELKIENKVMAAAVNMEIVKKENWDSYILAPNDKVELLQFVGGG